MSVEANKTTIERFFHEALDAGNAALIPELFVDGGMRYYPGRTVQVKTGGPLPPPRNSTAFRTEIHHLFGEGDNVVARITHHVTFGPGAEFVTQMGTFSASEKSISWGATVIFRFEGGKIAEEWVNRDELGILRQLGHVGP